MLSGSVPSVGVMRAMRRRPLPVVDPEGVSAGEAGVPVLELVRTAVLAETRGLDPRDRGDVEAAERTAARICEGLADQDLVLTRLPGSTHRMESAGTEIWYAPLPSVDGESGPVPAVLDLQVAVVEPGSVLVTEAGGEPVSVPAEVVMSRARVLMAAAVRAMTRKGRS